MTTRLLQWVDLQEDYKDIDPELTPKPGDTNTPGPPNCVVSLCDDGQHMPALDIDYPCELQEADKPMQGFGFTHRLLFQCPIDSGLANWLENVFKRYGMWFTAYDKTWELYYTGTTELVEVRPSETDGHCHLLLDLPMSWGDYSYLLSALATCGLIEPGYASASIERGYSRLALAPWKQEQGS